MNKKPIYILVLITTIIVGIWSCERDDICAESTITTPHLIIRFYDASSPDETKQARRLSIRGIDDGGNELTDIVTNTNTDSIVLPLRFQNENELTTTRFILEKDTDFRLDEDVATESNVDIIEISYTPRFEYISRACGYRSIFEINSITIINDTENWIISREVLITTIENENQAHIILRH